jgi:predicted amidohydrolase YtcJ
MLGRTGDKPLAMLLMSRHLRRLSIILPLAFALAGSACDAQRSQEAKSRAGAAVASPRAPEAADLVVRGGPILTMDPQRPLAEVLAIKHGRILRIGSASDVAPLVGSSTEVIELGSRAAVPGFIDCHTHLGLDSYPAHRLFAWDPSKAELMGKLKAEVEVKPELPLILGGWFPAHYTGSRRDLDAISTRRPILVVAADMHAIWLNSAAAAWLGLESLNAGQPEALPREASGQRPGVLAGFPWTRWAHLRATDMAEQAALEQGIAGTFRAVAATGITAVHNMSFTTRSVRILSAMADRGALPVRVREMPYGLDANMVEAMRGMKYSHPDSFRFSAVKYLLDGAPFSGSGAYSGIAHPGKVRISSEELRRRLTDHTRRGEQVALHAVGQVSVHAALEAIEATRGIGPLRPRIEHGDVLERADEDRLSRLGVVLSMQPSHFPASLPRADFALTPPEKAWGFARHVRRSVPVCLGSDGPVPPLVNIALAMRGPTSAEALTLDEAFAAHTRWAAYAANEENEVGVLSEGKLGDLVILSRDPRGLDPQGIMGITVERTIVGGRTTYRAPSTASAPP